MLTALLTAPNPPPEPVTISKKQAFIKPSAANRPFYSQPVAESKSFCMRIFHFKPMNYRNDDKKTQAKEEKEQRLIH